MRMSHQDKSREAFEIWKATNPLQGGSLSQLAAWQAAVEWHDVVVSNDVDLIQQEQNDIMAKLMS